MAESASTEERVRAAAFEGLFVRALDVKGAFAERLQALGVDLARMEDTYPIRTWHAAVDLARREFFPGLGVEDGQFQLGRAFARGFASTLVGKVIAAAAPMVGPARFLRRMPTLINTSRVGKGMAITLEVVSTRETVLHCVDPLALPYFNAGLIHEIVVVCRATPTVTVERTSTGGFDLRARW